MQVRKNVGSDARDTASPTQRQESSPTVSRDDAPRLPGSDRRIGQAEFPRHDGDSSGSFERISDAIHGGSLRIRRNAVNAYCVTQRANTQDMDGLDTPGKRLIWARERDGRYKTPTDAARAFGWNRSTYSGHENGDRVPSRANAIKYAKTYKIRWEWLLEASGSPTAGKPTEAKVIGLIHGIAEIRFDNSVTKEVELPPGGGVNTVALEVRGESPMRGLADDGWLFFFDNLKEPPTSELYGKLCVVELKDDRVLVRTLQRGRKKNRYDLEFGALPTLRDCTIKWAAKVLWIKPK